MSDIFISYAREDRPRAEAVAKALEAHGWSVWWDRDIRAGETFRRVIRDEIQQARCVLVLWSEQSVESDWVNEEASIGKRRNILVPVLTGRVEPPLGFGSLQTADLTGWDGDATAPDFRGLCSDIEALIGAPKEPARGIFSGAVLHPVSAAERPVSDHPAPGKVAPPEQDAARTFGRRWVLGGVLLAALVYAGYLVSKLPVRRTSPPPNAQTDQKDAYVRIEPGQFQMGATPGDAEADDHEKPRHPVRITKRFWLGTTAVTVADYKRFVDERPQFKMPDAPAFNPDWSKPDHPIVSVTWDEAKAYCESAGGRLQTEAEWEYAARGGKDGLKYPWGDTITPENANYRGSKWDGTSPVRSYPPNAWGLYDMAGNVWEWVADLYGEYYYGTLPLDKPVDDPRGPQSGTLRGLRGGSFNDDTRYLRAAVRSRWAPGYRFDFVGFRCVREVVP